MLLYQPGKVFNRAKSRTEGYTIDQTILIVAIIAILVTLIIISVGWQLINRTTGTKLAAQFRQLEEANGQFYSAFRVWPHTAYTGTASAVNNALALTGGTVTFTAAVPAAQRRNFIPGFSVLGGNVTHKFSSAGAVTQGIYNAPFGLVGNFLVVQFANVPFSDVREAEMAVDAGSGGTADYAAGRVVASTGTCIGTAPTGVTAATTDGTLVNTCYAANLVQ